MNRFSLIAALALLAAPATAQVSEERVAAFVALIEGHGCEVTQGEAPQFFPPNGFPDPNETREIVAALMERGLAERSPERLRLLTGNCPGN